MTRIAHRTAAALAAIVILSARADAQIVFTTGGSSTTTFDNLVSVVTTPTPTWTNNTTVPGFYAFQSGGTPAAVTSYQATTGTATAGGLYSFGSVGVAERALGTVGSGTVGNFAYGAIVQNSGADPIAISLAFDGEQWRNSAAAAQSVTFSYRATTTNPNTISDWTVGTELPSGYTAVSGLTFTSPVTGGTAGSLDGNAPANRTTFSNTSIATINPGEYLTLRWFDADHSGVDHALAIDSVVITAVVTPVPEPVGVLSAAALAAAAIRLLRRRQASDSI